MARVLAAGSAGEADELFNRMDSSLAVPHVHLLFLMGYDARIPMEETIRTWLYDNYRLHPKTTGQAGWYSNCELNLQRLVYMLLYLMKFREWGKCRELGDRPGRDKWRIWLQTRSPFGTCGAISYFFVVGLMFVWPLCMIDAGLITQQSTATMSCIGVTLTTIGASVLFLTLSAVTSPPMRSFDYMYSY